MKEWLSIGCLAGFGIMPFTIMLGYFYTHKLIARLKSRHVDLWNSIGRPRPVFGNSLETLRNLKKFVKNPSGANDTQINAFAKTLRWVQGVHFFAFGLAVVCYILVLIADRSKN